MSELRRQLNTASATVLGIGSMIGAGLFSSFGPAAASAGSFLLLSLGIAALIALCNALSSAQLAAQYPTSGGTYAFGRERLGPWWGFAAGWCFIIGKIASLGAMSLTFGHYVAPDHARIAALGVLVFVAVINHLGITRTATLTGIILAIVLITLGAVLVSTWASSPAPVEAPLDTSAFGVLQGAAILFFAFAGYARIATLGEEVQNPRSSIPRTIVSAFAIVLAIYAITAFTLTTFLGPAGIALSDQPVADLTTNRVLQVGLQVGVASACAGAMLGLFAGIGRTGLAMARNRDLPFALSVVHPRGVPARIDLLVLIVVAALILLTDIRGAIGFSSFGVLLYYAIANLSALTQEGEWARYPRIIQVVGLFGCIILAATVPWQSLVVGPIVLTIGLVGRAIITSIRS